MPGLERDGNRLRDLVGVERNQSRPQRLEALDPGLDRQKALFSALYRSLPAIERHHPGNDIHARGQAALYQHPSDSLRVLGPGHGGEHEDPFAHPRPRASIAWTWAAVRGTTESRPWRRSGLPAKAATVLSSTRGTGRASRPPGRTPTPTSRESSAPAP